MSEDDAITRSTPPVVGARAAASAGERSGETIGPYRLLEMLGEGGFGTVWLAERREPFVQRVALKIIKAGMDSKAVIARFEQERQALAVMDHPNVARVLDVGVTPAAMGARPYFVMEHVKGEPITEYCDRQRLTMRQRLELFIPVCEAVQHAHTKGIIHRDLKPGNVLVTTGDGAPAPKVIDFGVAKAVSGTLTDKTIFTESGQIIGTPEYMSPEQAEMGATDIDTRTDVYALGVLLYELVTGSLPFEPAMLRSKGYAEIQRVIREVDPPRPSTKLTSLGAGASAVAVQHRTDAGSMVRELKRELEWVPLKAMRKDRNERYRTPGDLADDVRNYLAGRALAAGPESTAYRVRKIMRRHRGAFIGAGAVAGALLLGAGGFAWQAAQARGERDRARAAEQAARDERDRAAFIKDYLVRTLQYSDPTLTGRSDILLTEAMERGVEGLDERVEREHPEAAAEILGTTAAVLHSNGAADRALPLAERSLSILRRIHPGDDPGVARAMIRAGVLRYEAGRLLSAIALCEESVAMCDRLYASDHADAAEALSTLAFMREAAGRSEDAERLGRRAIAMYGRLPRGNDSAREDAMTHVAYSLESQGRLEEAERLCAEVLEARQRTLSKDHPTIADAYFNLGRMRLGLGRAKEAEEALVKSIEIQRRVYRGEHRSMLVAMYNLAGALTMQERYAEAIRYADDAVAMGRRLLEPGHPAISRALWRAGSARLAAGDARGALPLLEECVGTAEAHESENIPRLKEYRETLARCRDAIKP